MTTDKKELQILQQATIKYLRTYLLDRELSKAKLEATTENISSIIPIVDNIINEYINSEIFNNLTAAIKCVELWNYNIKFENLLNHVLENKPVNKSYLLKMHESEKN